MDRADRGRNAIAAAALALLLAGAGPALAQWRPEGRTEGRGGGRGEAYQAREPRGGGWGGERARPAPMRGYGGPGYGGPGGYGGGYGRAPREEAYGPPGGYGGGQRAWRRGETLPDGYRGATVPDPGRYHLRRPPNGYDWVGDNRNAYLMQRSTGLVLDSVPGAYEPPPPYRGRRR